MNGLKDLLSHKRTWALLIGLIFQILTVILGNVLAGDQVATLTENLPYLLAGLWTVLVLGQAYEDRVTRGETSALTTTLDDSKPEGGWSYALISLLGSEGFWAALSGSVVAIVTLCVPLWPGLAHLQDICIQLAQLLTMVFAALVGGLKYSGAWSESRPS